MPNDYRPTDALDGGSADIALSFAAFGAQNLRAQSGFPNYCPQRMLVSVKTAGNLVVTDRNGNSNTLDMPVGMLEVNLSVATMVSGTMAGSVTFMWWINSATRFNP